MQGCLASRPAENAFDYYRDSVKRRPLNRTFEDKRPCLAHPRDGPPGRRL